MTAAMVHVCPECRCEWTEDGSGHEYHYEECSRRRPDDRIMLRETSHAANLHEQAEQRVYTNDLDALEALIVEGLPPDEMQAAAWVLVQRVRGLQTDLARVEKARAAWQREARNTDA